MAPNHRSWGAGDFISQLEASTERQGRPGELPLPPTALPLDEWTLYHPLFVSRVKSWVQLTPDTSSGAPEDRKGGRAQWATGRGRLAFFYTFPT